jgi:hypothetical protein
MQTGMKNLAELPGGGLCLSANGSHYRCTNPSCNDAGAMGNRVRPGRHTLTCGVDRVQNRRVQHRIGNGVLRQACKPRGMAFCQRWGRLRTFCIG